MTRIVWAIRPDLATPHTNAICHMAAIHAQIGYSQMESQNQNIRVYHAQTKRLALDRRRSEICLSVHGCTTTSADRIRAKKPSEQLLAITDSGGGL